MSKPVNLSSEGQVSRRNGEIYKTDSDIRYDIHYPRRFVIPNSPSSDLAERWYPKGDSDSGHGHSHFQRRGEGEERSRG
jgi:hypothetical protein